VLCAQVFLLLPCTCISRTAPQALCGCRGTSPAQYGLYVPALVLSSLLSEARGGVSAPICPVVCLWELSGDPWVCPWPYDPFSSPLLFCPPRCLVLQHPLFLPLVLLLYWLPYPLLHPLLSYRRWVLGACRCLCLCLCLCLCP